MNTSDIINLIIAIVSIIPTIVSVVILVVNIIKNKNWNLITTIADAAMKTVEDYARTHPGMTSDEKQEMALTAIKEALAAANIKVDTKALERIINYIKEAIA